MKNTIYLFIILILAVLIFTCSTDESNKEQLTNINLTTNTWEVIKIKKQVASIYLNADKGYTIEFKTDETYILNISPNTCGGDYETTNNKSITIIVPVCTEIAGQTEFATNLLSLFPEMTKYYLEDDELIFEGRGEIVLKPL